MNYFERAKFFRTKKRLGQNFLVNGEVIQDIIEFAQISPDDTVVEIGPLGWVCNRTACEICQKSYCNRT